MKRILLACAAASACTLPALSLADFNYTNIDISYVDVEFDIGPFNVDGDGFAIGGNYKVADSFYIGGEYEDYDFDFGVDGEVLEIGGGYFHTLNEELDFIATLAYVEVEASVSNFSADDDGLQIGGGIRALLSDKFEVDAMLEYLNMDQGDSDTGVELRGRYYFSDDFAVSGQIDFGSDVETLRIGIRFEF